MNIFKANKLNVHEINDKSRDKNILRQVGSSIIFKFISVAIGLSLVPILLNKLGQENYGIWAVLLSLMQWIALMDIGIGNGLRYKLTESLAQNNLVDARSYVSTAYYSMGFFATILIVVLAPVLFLVDWGMFFNTAKVSATELTFSILVFVYSIIIYFVLSLINQVINAVQRNALTSLVPILANLLFLGVLIFLLPANNASLLQTSIAYALCLNVTVFLFSLLFFDEYKHLKPSIKLFEKGKIKSILNLGIKFFVIQITCIIIFSTDNVIITHLFGPKYVTAYSIPFMVFNNIGMLVNLIMMTFYSSYTEAYSKGQLEWIQKKVTLLCKLILPFAIGVSIVVFLFPFILKIWIKTPVKNIPDLLPIFMGIYIVITVWNNIFAYVLGAIGKINLGMYLTIFIGILNIPLSIYLARNCGLGLNGIILSNIICLGFGSIISPLQVFYFIFYNKKSLKWDKILR